jgi:hypothetical protein
VGLLLWCSAQAGIARADFKVAYGVKNATLKLFNQEQTSPFAGVGGEILVKGDRLRLEVEDHFGRRHTWIVDRAHGQVWQLFEDSSYVTYKADCSCARLPQQVASTLAEAKSAGGLDSLSVLAGDSRMLDSLPVWPVQISFRASLFGIPRPVWVHATIFFPTDEQAQFGACVSELYCGKKPSASAWQSAFTQLLAIPPEGARALAKHAGLPMTLEFAAELGVGTATLSLDARDAQCSVLDPRLFRVPDGYRAVSPTE